jgi:hypothetical protein
VERNDSGVGSDSGLSVSYPKIVTLNGQEDKTTDGATCRECDSVLAGSSSSEQSHGGATIDLSSSSLCGKCAKRKGERKEIIR